MHGIARLIEAVSSRRRVASMKGDSLAETDVPGTGLASRRIRSAVTTHQGLVACGERRKFQERFHSGCQVGGARRIRMSLEPPPAAAVFNNSTLLRPAADGSGGKK